MARRRERKHIDRYMHQKAYVSKPYEISGRNEGGFMCPYP